MAMSETDSTKQGPALAASVAEVQGAFPNDETMQDALSQLTLAGYDRADFSLPDEQQAQAANTPTEGAENPTDDTDKAQLRTLGTSMAGYAGAVAAAGAILATGGAAALAIGGAAAIGAGTAAAANATGQAADQAGVDKRNQRGEAGTLILAVRTTTQAQADQVIGIMQQAGATKATPINRSEGNLTAGVSAASWTGG